MTDQIQAIAGQIEANFIAGLKGLELSPEDGAIVQRVTARLAEAGLDSIGADAATQADLKQLVDLDLATLANLAVGEEIDAEQLARQSARQALSEALAIGLKAVIAVA